MGRTNAMGVMTGITGDIFAEVFIVFFEQMGVAAGNFRSIMTLVAKCICRETLGSGVSRCIPALQKVVNV